MLAAAVAAADLALVGAGAHAFRPGPVPVVEIRLALAVGLVLVAAGSYLLLILPRVRVFPCRPFASVSLLLMTGATGLWMWFGHAAPIDALLRRDPIADLAVGLAIFSAAAVCSTLAVASVLAAWDARQQERLWGSEP